MSILAPPEEKEALRTGIRRIVKQFKPKSYKARVKVPTVLDNIFHSKNQKSISKYFTTGRKIPSTDRLPNYMKPTGKWKTTGNILERVQIPEEDYKIKCVTDLDPEFFTVVEGRPLKQKFNIREYKKEVRKRLLVNLKAGFVQDQLKLREEQAIAAQHCVEQMEMECKKNTDSLKAFMADDFKNTTMVEAEYKAVEEFTETLLEKLKTEQGKMSAHKIKLKELKNQLDEALELQRFFLELSPMVWQKEYGMRKEKRVEMVKPYVDELKRMFEFYKSHCSGWEPVIEEIIENFIDVFATAGPCDLYFEDSKKIMFVMKKQELGNLQILIDRRILERRKKVLLDARSQLKDMIEEETAIMDASIADIQAQLKVKAKSIRLKKVMLKDLSEGAYRDICTNQEMIVQKGLMKELYESVFAYGCRELSVMEMLQEINSEFKRVFDLLRNIPRDEIMRRVKKLKRSEIAKMKSAEKARQRSIQIDQAVAGLMRAHEKKFVPSGKPVMFKTIREKRVTRKEEVKEAGGPPEYEEELRKELELLYPLATHVMPSEKMKAIMGKRELMEETAERAGQSEKGTSSDEEKDEEIPEGVRREWDKNEETAYAPFAEEKDEMQKTILNMKEPLPFI